MAVSERDKMMAGQLYFAIVPELAAARAAARALTREFNGSSASTPDELRHQRSILKRLVGSMPDDEPPFVEPPFVCDYVKPPTSPMTKSLVCIRLSTGFAD